MSKVKLKDGPLETSLRSALHKRGLRFRKHITSLPGTPDLVFPSSRLAVFIDGDFWHGFRFPAWKDKLTPFWRNKIQTNRVRDKRNFAKLRRGGWHVIRFWGHEIEANLDSCLERVEDALKRHRRAD